MPDFSQETDPCWVQAPPPEPIGPFVELGPQDIEQSLPSLFEQQAARFGTKLALTQGAHNLTYDELNRQSNRIARALLDRIGVREEPVALLLSETAKTIAATLGALKAGKIYTPIDPETPRSRAAYILKDCEARLVITDEANIRLARELSDPSVSFVVLEDLPSASPKENPALSIAPDRLASLYYTSGSTGQPKGVPLSHRSRLATHRSYANALRISPADRLTLLYSCTFAGAVNNLFGSLLSGASLFPFDLKVEGLGGLAVWLDENRITIYHSVPTVFRGLVETLQGRRLPHLRAVLLASDTMHEEDVLAFHRCLAPGCRLGNFWGASEAAFNRVYWVDAAQQLPRGTVPAIGPPREEDDDEIFLLDENGRRVLSGQAGEIVLKSRHLTPGYWRKPELTRKVFETANGAEARLYHTGDLGRALPDGSIIHLGRKDFQVQIRGYRVEIEEVEAALRSLPGVRECAVTAHEENGGERYLVGHVVVESARRADGPAIRRSLRDRIPGYMIPAKFIIHESLPLTSGGKVDRKTLRDAEAARSGNPDHEPALGSEEAELVRMWEGMLGVSPVGLHDNFFDLGGNSMLALHIIARIERRFETWLPLATLLEAPTIAELAERLRQPDHPGHRSVLVPIRSGGSRPPLFLVHATGGNVLNYRELSNALGDDQPVYGLQARGLDDKTSPHASVEDMARDYVAEVRAAVPDGPYMLGGSSFGGVVAYEMACELARTGNSVDLLVLIDASPARLPAGRAPGDALQRRASRLGGRIRVHSRNLWKLNPAGRANYVRRSWRTLQQRLGSLVWRVRMARRLRRGERLPATLRNVQEACRLAAVRYDPKPYPGPVLLVRATDRDPLLESDPLASWGSLLRGRVEVEEIRATHTSILDQPQVSSLARAIQRRIDRVVKMDRGSNIGDKTAGERARRV